MIQVFEVCKLLYDTNNWYIDYKYLNIHMFNEKLFPGK